MKRRFDTLAEFRVYVSVTGLALLLEGFFIDAGENHQKRRLSREIEGKLVSFDSERHALTTTNTQRCQSFVRPTLHHFMYQ